jgi:signal transduction histidine kinase
MTARRGAPMGKAPTPGARMAGDVRQIAEEQAALRRVATLVARAAPPEEVFATVAAETGRMLGADHATLSRHEFDGAIKVVASWSGTGTAIPVGTRMSLGGRNVHTLAVRTGRAARLDDYADVSGAAAGIARELGILAAVAAPVSVEGRLWGLLTVASTHGRPLPADTEARLAGFTELAATAIANAQARAELRSFAAEQAALRRVATLVALGVRPVEVFSAVSSEASGLFGSSAAVLRFDHDGSAIVFVGVSSGLAIEIGTRWEFRDGMASAEVYRTGRSARVDEMNWSSASGPVAATARRLGVVSTVCSPIVVQGRLWGAMSLSSTDQLLSTDTEKRLEEFTGLVATAIANTEAQAALAASRVRIVAAADATRRRIERNLHDGAQQRLVSLALHLREAQAAVPPGGAEAVQRLDGAVAEVTGVLEELREIARGLHPAVLTEGGLYPALRALANRSPVPVELDVGMPGRLPEPVETAAYYAVAEALTNVAKHAHASAVEVKVAVGEGVLRASVRDDGRGGAGFGRGSGLVGLKDRVEALGGRIRLGSLPGAGTALDIVLPLSDPSGPPRPLSASVCRKPERSAACSMWQLACSQSL